MACLLKSGRKPTHLWGQDNSVTSAYIACHERGCDGRDSWHRRAHLGQMCVCMQSRQGVGILQEWLEKAWLCESFSQPVECTICTVVSVPHYNQNATQCALWTCEIKARKRYLMCSGSFVMSYRLKRTSFMPPNSVSSMRSQWSVPLTATTLS